VKCPGETESRLVVARLRIKGKGIDQDFFWGDKNVLESDTSEGCTILWILKTNEVYNLKG
jgi:hypothetical protein